MTLKLKQEFVNLCSKNAINYTDFFQFLRESIEDNIRNGVIRTEDINIFLEVVQIINKTINNTLVLKKEEIRT